MKHEALEFIYITHRISKLNLLPNLIYKLGKNKIKDYFVDTGFNSENHIILSINKTQNFRETKNNTSFG